MNLTYFWSASIVTLLLYVLFLLTFNSKTGPVELGVLSFSLQARIQKKLYEELPQEWMGDIKLGQKVSGNQGLSKS